MDAHDPAPVPVATRRRRPAEGGAANFLKIYPYGIMVNAGGERFLDEGAHFRNYT